VDIEFDPAKRRATLDARGMDMADAGEVFFSDQITFADIRFEYGERRFVTIGYLGDRMVVLAWTARGDARRIISMRKANERETKKYGPRLG
jgi:uncharacterized DUF497 family protein